MERPASRRLGQCRLCGRQFATGPKHPVSRHPRTLRSGNAETQEGRAALQLAAERAKAEQGAARSLPLPNSSIDGTLFSPRYSFAVDYVENDASHLRMLAVDLDGLRERIVGLRGRTLRQMFVTYVEDMKLVLAECARVLRPQRSCAIVIGTSISLESCSAKTLNKWMVSMK